MAINARKKGQRGEKQAIGFLQDWTGLQFARTPASGGLRWHKAENISGDIVCTEKNYIFPYSIEVKFPREINFNHLMYHVNSDILKYWDQAVADAKRAEKIPILLMRYNGLPKNFFFVVMKNLDASSIHEVRYFKKPYMRIRIKGYYLFVTTTEALLEKDAWEVFESYGQTWLADRQHG